MEKFGIFELLDALSALTAQNEPIPPAEEKTQSAEKPMRQDAAFDPPSYGKETAHSGGSRETDALADFLARHDAVARKAEKK